MNIFKRIYLYWNFKKLYKFQYDVKTGEGIAPLRYDPFYHTVYLRYSRFGYVSGNYNGYGVGFESFKRNYELRVQTDV